MTMESDDSSQPGREKRTATIQSVSLAARFLEILANAEGPLTLGAVARRADAGSSTAHRYMQSLVKEGLAAQDSGTGMYDLGPAALSIGIAALRRIEPVDIAARHMKNLASVSSASGGVAIWTERGPTVVRWYRSAVFSISSVGLGDVLPLDNSACGLVFQAFLPASRIEHARALQPDQFRGRPPSQERLAEIRASGRAELNSHLLPDVTGRAVAILDAQAEIACVMTTVTNLGQSESAEERNRLFDYALMAARESGTPILSAQR
ncbi:IclR family transcriptional regulator [Jiella avicenniae]|uniref:IclR family transcriptional regulator n=1 Tax=Jiella avicenniae TaxID=2907202 RepID=A0A9X1T5U4_9HYPH|nr:IclR family transcriptional regulator [Jiella avicenniae]MCE7029229.1 IclR family transcriptional regulator [Jiella avicenniae]